MPDLTCRQAKLATFYLYKDLEVLQWFIQLNTTLNTCSQTSLLYTEILPANFQADLEILLET